jgi:hypothetical protein
VKEMEIIQHQPRSRPGGLSKETLRPSRADTATTVNRKAIATREGVGQSMKNWIHNSTQDQRGETGSHQGRVAIRPNWSHI